MQVPIAADEYGTRENITLLKYNRCSTRRDESLLQVFH
jgi:hypothetical protein